MSEPIQPQTLSSSAAHSGAAAELSETIGFCPACGHPSTAQELQLQFLSARGESPWVQCSQCRSYHLVGSYDSQDEASHTAQMPWGQQDAGIELNHFKRRMFESALSGIDRLLPEARTILDVGCSFGGFLTEARRYGYEAAGVDIVPEAVQYVQQQGFRAEQCASLKDCRLFSSQNPVDVLTVLDAHIYWPDQPGELKTAWSLIRPGGLLVMRAITKSHFVTAGRALGPVAPKLSRQLIRRAVTDHRFCMPLPSLLETIRQCGFTIEVVSTRDAQHSNQSSLAVRSLFSLGELTWKMLRKNLAPGAMIFARKPST